MKIQNKSWTISLPSTLLVKVVDFVDISTVLVYFI
nr:MAG TPA: hypothetical protein [Caudoviricetes sp.]